MHTNLRVDGANCPLCLNELVDRLRSVDGIRSVNSSISDGCVAIDHDNILTRSDLVGLIGVSLHGTDMASNEIVMSTIDPVVTMLQCAHESEHHPSATVSAGHRLETVTDALTRLRADGYTADFYATDQGQLACRGCDRTMNPTDVQVDHTVRFEGDTNPDDQDILFAIQCACGCKGTYSSAYGPATPPADSAVLRQLAHATHPDK